MEESVTKTLSAAEGTASGQEAALHTVSGQEAAGHTVPVQEAAGHTVSPQELSPLALAFMGDAVYEQYIREWVVMGALMPPDRLNARASAFSKATAQSALIRILAPELTEEENDIFRRGKNAHTHTKAKNASLADYRFATGFEALIGYLYLTGRMDRVRELLAYGLSRLPAEITAKSRN